MLKAFRFAHHDTCPHHWPINLKGTYKDQPILVDLPDVSRMTVVIPCILSNWEKMSSPQLLPHPGDTPVPGALLKFPELFPSTQK